MALSLNQIVQRITNYGLSHAMINHVHFGEIYNWLSNEDATYPSMFFNLENGVILEKQTKFFFSIYLLDRQLQETDGLEEISDMTLIAQDIIALFRNNDNPWIIDNNIILDYIVEGEPDYLAGVKMTVGITISNINNRCEVPII
jgi:hypothetical protein